MKNKLKIPKIHNRFDFEIRNARTGELEGKAYAENIVLDRMYTRLVIFGTFFTQIVFGSGTGTPTSERTTLFNRVGNKACSTIETIVEEPVSKWTCKIRLEASEYNGNTLTEVGISETSTSINTHAMIKDSEGNPLSIEKTDIKIIDIYATIFIEYEDISPGKWLTPFKKYLAGGTDLPQTNLGISNSDLFGVPIIYSTSTKVTDSMARTVNSSTRFDNYTMLGIDTTNTGVRFQAYRTCYGDRKLEIPVNLIVWQDLGQLPIAHDSYLDVEYTISAEEAAQNKLYVPHYYGSTTTEVKLNENTITDWTYTQTANYSYDEVGHPYLTHISHSTIKNYWPTILDGNVFSSGHITSGEDYGDLILESTEGFNLLFTVLVNQNSTAPLFKYYGRNLETDDWISLSEKLGLFASGVFYRYYIINTDFKYLKINASMMTGQGDMTLSYWQMRTLPIMNFTSTVLTEGDIITITRHHINEIPKNIDYLIDADMTIQFGEGE